MEPEVVQHQVTCKSRGGDEIWSVDSERCKFSPRRLLLEKMPKKVVAVRAHMVSNKSSLHTMKQLPDIHYPGYPAISHVEAAEAFAYKGNVDMPAWKMRSIENPFIKLQNEGLM